MVNSFVQNPKYDFSKWYWKAYHSDKVVELPNYIDINRDTLQKLEIYNGKKGKLILTINKPKSGKFKLGLRLKSNGYPSNIIEDGKVVKTILHITRRCIIIYDGINYTKLDEEGDVRYAKTMEEHGHKPLAFKSNLGEEV